MGRMSGTRRDFLMRTGQVVGGTALLSIARMAPAGATQQGMQDAIRAIAGDASLQTGKVRLDIPTLVENGNTVPLTVAVESPMTEADHAKAIHIVNEKNPQPHVISVTLGPRCGRAAVSTRIKLADSQQIVALAEMSDGSFWMGSTDVVVTLAACVEDLVR